MKVIVTNVTGSQKQEGLLDKDSGVIEYTTGEITHVLYEKQMNKTIFVVKEAKREEVKPQAEEVKAPSTEQSEPRQEKKTKKKSN